MSTYAPAHDLPSTTRVVRFLLDRIEEDEARLRRASRRLLPTAPEQGSTITHLREECLAKRQVIGALQQQILLRDQAREGPVRQIAFRTLCVMAGVYAGHNGFDATWSEIAADAPHDVDVSMIGALPADL